MSEALQERGWARFLSERDKLTAQEIKGVRMGFGRRPALLVVDVTHKFCGPRPDESAAGWRKGYAEDAWRAVGNIAGLLPLFRSKGVPIIYTTRQEPGEGVFFEGRWQDKRASTWEPPTDPLRNRVVDDIRPGDRDIVIEKMKPSAFFGTPLVGYLVDLGVDSLIVCGVATGGCVLATVLDAFSFNYRVAVIEEATFDRFEASHWVGLFDMDTKNADVVNMSDVVGHLERLPGGEFEDSLRDLVGRRS